MVQNRLRILVISNYYPPDIKGGLEISASIICNSLAKVGHEVTVLTREGTTEYIELQENPGVHRILTHSFRFEDTSKSFSRFAGWKAVNAAFNNGAINGPMLRAFLKSRSFDVAICFSLEDLGQSLAGVPAEFGIPVLWSVGDYWRIKQREFGTKGILAKLRRKMISKQVNLELSAPFDNVVFISENFRNQFASEGIEPKNSNVIYRSYPIPDSVPPIDSPDRKGRLVIASQLVPHKGVHIAIEAFANLRKNKPDLDFRLEIFGGGDPTYVKQLEAQIVANELKDRVFLCGRIPPDQVAIEFQNAVAVIHPVLWEEPFGRVAIEAMANGAVLIPSDIGAIREIVGESFDLLYKFDDAQELADRIERVLLEPELCRKIAAQLREKQKKEFSPETECAKYEAILLGIVALGQ